MVGNQPERVRYAAPSSKGQDTVFLKLGLQFESARGCHAPVVQLDQDTVVRRLRLLFESAQEYH